MTLPAMHGWTHRPKALGGTDPIDIPTGAITWAKTYGVGNMMWARASKRALDDFAPWVTVGVLASEEVIDAEVVPDPFEDGD